MLIVACKIIVIRQISNTSLKFRREHVDQIKILNRLLIKKDGQLPLLVYNS